MSKPIVLHIGDPIVYNPEIYAKFSDQFTVIRPSLEERQRPAFLQALKDRKWGDFQAVFRPFWNTGGEMGRWDAEMIPLLPKSMKLFASAGAGYDWADVDLLANEGILYCNGASASSEAVADMAIYHTLSVFRNIQWSNNAARSGSSEEFLDAHKNATLTSHNPRGHTIGIIGMGNIGYTIATKAYKCFGVKIVYYDLYPKTPEQEKAIEATRIETLDGMLAVSDCVVLATPGAGGKKVIDAETLAKFKKGSRLVNIARGTLVDEEALADALESGHLCAAGLDVHDNEPHVNARLVKRNVSLTCHNAGGAIETNVGFEALAMQNIEAVLTGKAPLTPVNQRMGVFATKGG